MIPGPMLYGMIIDRACKVWMPTCTGRGACLLYDTTMYRLLLHGTTAGIQVRAGVWIHSTANKARSHGMF